MTNDRIADIREIVGWTRGKLAGILNVTIDTVRHWESGRRRIPQRIADWMERVAAWHETHPPHVADWTERAAEWHAMNPPPPRPLTHGRKMPT